MEKTVAGSEESTRPEQKNGSGPVLNFHIGRDAWSNCRVQEHWCLMAVHRFTPLPSTPVFLLLLVLVVRKHLFQISLDFPVKGAKEIPKQNVPCGV